MKLVTARVEYREQQSWSLGKQYEWARDLYPADLIEKIEFRENSESNSKILTSLEWEKKKQTQSSDKPS